MLLQTCGAHNLLKVKISTSMAMVIGHDCFELNLKISKVIVDAFIAHLLE